jgi:NADH pyrophosphatase NudC (nudix superfamily)
LVKEKYEILEQKKVLDKIKYEMRDIFQSSPNAILSESIELALIALIQKCSTDEFDKHLKTIENLRNQFKSCVIALCKELGIERKVVKIKYKKFCDGCGDPIDISKNHKFCPKCGKPTIVE